MSLEEHIVNLIAALKAHGEALVAHAAAIAKAPKGKKGEAESAPTPPANTPAASAPAAGSSPQASAPTPTPSPSPSDAAANTNPTLLNATTEMVIKLANEYSREKAVAILAARKVTRCSDLKVGQLQAVLDEATAAVNEAEAAKQAAAANASLV